MINLSARWPSFVNTTLFLLACIFKCAMLSIFNRVSSDKSLQISAAHSINEGRGYSISITDPSNASTANHRLTEWPPLYSVMIAPLLRLTNGNESSSALILDCIFGISGLLIIAAILKRLNIAPALVMLIIWYKALEINEAIEGAFSTDQIALVFFAAALYFTMLFYDRRSYATAFAISVCLALMMFTRYMYLPVSILYALLMLIIALVGKNRRDLIGGMISFVIILCGVTFLLWFNNHGGGQYYYIDPAPRGIFLENLTFFYPVAWQAFGNVHLLMTQLLYKAPGSRDFLYRVLQVSSAAALLFFLFRYLGLLSAMPKKGFKKSMYLWILSGCASYAVCFIILSLAVTHNRLRSVIYPSFWTYAEEARYFILPSLVLFLFVCQKLLTRTSTNPVRKMSRIIFVSCLVAGILHGSYYEMKAGIVSIIHHEVFLKYTDFEKSKFLADLGRAREEDKREFVMVTEQYGLISYGLRNHYRVIRDVIHFADSQQQATRPTLFIFVEETDAEGYYSPRLAKKGYRLVHHENGFSFYVKSQ